MPFFYDPKFSEDIEKDIKIKNNDKNNNIIKANFINNFYTNKTKHKNILQFWSGNLLTSKYDIPVKFLSTYPIEIFEKLQKLNESFSLSSKAIMKEVVNYIEKTLHKEDKLFIFSWVEISDEKYLVNFNYLYKYIRIYIGKLQMNMIKMINQLW